MPAVRLLLTAMISFSLVTPGHSCHHLVTHVTIWLKPGQTWSHLSPSGHTWSYSSIMSGGVEPRLPPLDPGCLPPFLPPRLFRPPPPRLFQTSFFLSMTVAYSDSGPTLYLFQGRGKPVLYGPNSTEPNLFRHGETTYRVG